MVKVKPPNPSGLCMCGCGRPTPLAKCTNVARGFVRGEHTRFVHGHGGRRTPPDNSYRKAPYTPTAEEIAEGCRLALLARKTGHRAWRKKRPSGIVEWEVPVIHINPCLAAELNLLRIGRRGV